MCVCVCVCVWVGGTREKNKGKEGSLSREDDASCGDKASNFFRQANSRLQTFALAEDGVLCAEPDSKTAN